MNTSDIKTLCERVGNLVSELDVQITPEELQDSIENYEEVLIGAALAKGYLDKCVEISEKTIPFIQETVNALTNLVEESDEDQDEDESEEDEE